VWGATFSARSLGVIHQAAMGVGIILKYLHATGQGTLTEGEGSVQLTTSLE